MIATKKLRALKASHSQQFSVSAKKLADFLESVEAEEAMLVQRLRDAEGRKVSEKINGTAISPNAEELAVLKDETRWGIHNSRMQVTGFAQP